jgi:hypothetical protein
VYVEAEASPAFLGGLDHLEDHRQRGLVRQAAALRSHRFVPHRRERALGSVVRTCNNASRDIVNARTASRSLIGQSTALRRRAHDHQDALRLVASWADAFKTLV